MSKSNDLLDALDGAFEVADEKGIQLARCRAAAAKAIAEQQAVLDAVTAEQTALVSDAETAHQDAIVALERLREQLNERIGNITGVNTNPRVTVR
jgi:division protein CdvB (Snf7/Vps24/ESCRT-III family)